jgi:hypothetical protein
MIIFLCEPTKDGNSTKTKLNIKAMISSEISNASPFLFPQQLLKVYHKIPTFCLRPTYDVHNANIFISFFSSPSSISLFSLSHSSIRTIPLIYLSFFSQNFDLSPSLFSSSSLVTD